MNDIDIAALDRSVESVRSFLKEGLITTDIWNRRDGLSLAGINQQPAAVALFNQITDALEEAYRATEFPPLNRFYMLDLETDKTMLIIRHSKEMLQGIMLDTTKTNLGMLLSVVLPRALDDVAKACR
ncbi:MAG: hypothetical protein COX57_07275 [Alphaproteobacteria bacterium CG_4_10_14_0_2_um_filter_63_37]|nr:MAG: hypothetical protein AUJ55_02080 [Proteobacteria bacterium CG1_02_64_396]PJA24676.1 MAG: hypothetical protein COX57_07275 [Alphaproteobacteria bacterium CG_4_10_14_0_2_um_filter_63_37]